MEASITAQIGLMVTFQDLLIESRQTTDFKYFSSQLKKKLGLFTAKLQRVEQLPKYLRAVCGLAVAPSSNLEGQLVQEN